MSHLDFRCEAYNNCKVGTFDSVTLNGRESAFRKFHQDDLKHWYRLLRRLSMRFAVLVLRSAHCVKDSSENMGLDRRAATEGLQRGFSGAILISLRSSHIRQNNVWRSFRRPSPAWLQKWP